jgi:hypothetical protein
MMDRYYDGILLYRRDFMLNIWIGRCEYSIYYPHNLFNAIYKESWFEDPLVKQMVEDVDNSKVIEPTLLRDFSGNVKSLIMLYEEPSVLINGNFLDENCARWVEEIGKQVDCCMTLTYAMPFGGGRIKSKEKFECRIANNGWTTETYNDFFKVFAEFMSETDGMFDEWIDPPEMYKKWFIPPFDL